MPPGDAVTSPGHVPGEYLFDGSDIELNAVAAFGPPPLFPAGTRGCPSYDALSAPMSRRDRAYSSGRHLAHGR